MAREQGGKGKKNVEDSLTTKIVQRNLIFGKYSESEMIDQLKGLALDPCSPQFSKENIRPLYNQILKLRKVVVLNDSEIPWRKRKLEQFVKDKLKPSSSFDVPDQQNISKLRRRSLSHASSMSCLVNSAESIEVDADKIIFESRSSSSLLTSEKAFPGKLISTEYSPVGLGNRRNKDMSPIIDSDESVIDSNPPTPGNPSLVIKNGNCHLNSPALHGPNKKHLKPPRESSMLLNFIGDHLQRCVIPVGPRFQTYIPEWSGPSDRSILIDQYKKNSDDSKWLGTQVWPTEMRNSGKPIGKRGSNSCRCASPGSMDCVKRHCLEARLFCQSDIGPAFFSWKFDEMGEQVKKSWTQKEQQSFESLMKKRPSSNGENFLKNASKSIPQKSRKDIIGYYFNVHIPQRMSIQRRLHPAKVIDTDDEDVSEDLGRAVNTSRSKKVKSQISIFTRVVGSSLISHSHI